MPGRTARAAWTCAITLTSQICCHWSRDVVSTLPPMAMPAFEQNRSIGPKRPSVSSTSRWRSPASATSVATARARSPSSAATASAPSRLRSLMATPRAPSATNRRATARPMPLAAPVTTTTLSASSMPEIVGSPPVTDADARSAFLRSQVAALGPLDFVVVGLSTPPFDAVQVVREENASFTIELSARDESVPYAAEQVTALASLGLVPPAGGKPGGWRSADGIGPSSVDDATEVVDGVLSKVFGLAAAAAVDVRHGSEREARAAVARVAKIRSTIEPVVAALSPDGKPVQDDDGDYVLDIGHVRVFVAPRALPGPPPPIIRVFAITNAEVTLSSELGLFLSRLNFSLMFGRFSIDADNASVWFDETLLGEHVTDEELRFTIEMVAGAANEWDQKIASMFGGKVRSPEGGPEAGAAAPTKPGQGGYL